MLYLYFIIIVVIVVLIIINDKKNNENINLKIELTKEKLKQSKEYKEYKKMDFYDVYYSKESLLDECKKMNKIAYKQSRSVWKDEIFLEKYAMLVLLNDLALEKYVSIKDDHDFYLFDINFDD